MKASVFLGQAFRLELQVQSKLRQIADLQALAGSERIPGHHPGSGAILSLPVVLSVDGCRRRQNS